MGSYPFEGEFLVWAEQRSLAQCTPEYAIAKAAWKTAMRLATEVLGRRVLNPAAAILPGYRQDGIIYFGPKPGVLVPQTTADLMTSPEESTVAPVAASPDRISKVAAEEAGEPGPSRS